MKKQKQVETTVRICDRDGRLLTDANAGQAKFLRLLYGTPVGRFALKGLTCPVVSQWVGDAMEHPLSTIAIPYTVKTKQIPMGQYQKEVYRSYNAFFTRAILPQYRPIDTHDSVLISPCDAKLTVLPIEEQTRFTIKGAEYRLSALVGCKRLAQQYIGGYCLVFRLTPDDYHRYCFPDDCKVGKTRNIDGVLHTVNPVSADYVKVYHRNSRAVTMLHTEHFGDLLQVEVGAMLVGKIVNHSYHPQAQVKRGDEKGYFAFGGSTIIVITPPNAVSIDADFMRNSREGAETRIRMGERIGCARVSHL